MKQPRVPEYREGDSVSKYIKNLILFLKDFSMAVWREMQNAAKEIEGIAYPVTSVNGKTGEVKLAAADVGALASSYKQQIENVGTLNLLRNSNFKQWVAQAGIMGMHGTKQYAGDAWICTNGNVSGKLNSDGEGYTDITLSSGGRIDQVVAGIDQYYGEMMTIALWLDDGTMAVGSGIVSSPVSNYQTPISANINGVYIHLQAGAGSQRRYMFIIDNQKNSSVKIKAASIIPGAYSPGTMLYRPKGYAVELAECLLYFEVLGEWNYNSYSDLDFTFNHHPKVSTEITRTVVSKTGTRGKIGKYSGGWSDMDVSCEGSASTTRIMAYGGAGIYGFKRLEISADL